MSKYYINNIKVLLDQANIPEEVIAFIYWLLLRLATEDGR